MPGWSGGSCRRRCWVGASLYDGISPEADGSSAMEFVDAPDVRALGEVEQDRTFRDRALAFARAASGAVVQLAAIKLGRFWSPWPNADTLRNRGVALASAVVTVPVFALIAVGVWDRRRDFRALALLAGPLLYFCGLHLVFVSSIRYRIPWPRPRAGSGGVRLGPAGVLGSRSGSSTPRPGDGNRLRLGGKRTMKRPGRFRKLILWTLALLVAVLVGGAIAAYHYVTEGDTLVAIIRREAPRYLPRCQLDLIQARIRPFAGQVLLHSISLGDRGAGGRASIAYLPYLQINYNPWAMFHGRFEPSEVVVPRPTIRLRRRDDGTWNCQGLLANPWPGPTGGSMPPIRIKDGTVELIGEGGEGARAPC